MLFNVWMYPTSLSRMKNIQRQSCDVIFILNNDLGYIKTSKKVYIYTSSFIVFVLTIFFL